MASTPSYAVGMSVAPVCPECVEHDPAMIRVDLVLVDRWDGDQKVRVCREVVRCPTHGAFWRWADREERLSRAPEAWQ